MNASSELDPFKEDHLLYEITQRGCEDRYLENDPYSQIFKIYNILVLALAPLNVLLNGLSLRIFEHRLWKNNSLSAILKSLSVFEICFGCSLFFHTITSKTLDLYVNKEGQLADNLTDYQSQHHVRLVAALIVIHQGLSGFLFAFQLSRNWSVVLLAAYRYDAICRKLGTVSSFPRERIPLIMIITLISAGLFALPRMFEIKSYICAPTAIIYQEEPLLARSIFYQLIYLGIGTFIVQSGGPVLCVCVLSSFVIRKIAIRRRFRRQNQRTVLVTSSKDDPGSGVEPLAATKTVERNQPSGDKLMLALCFTFFILETPAFFSKILSSYTSKYHPTVDVYMSVIANLLIYLDSTFNAFVYMGSNPTFRQVAKSMFGRDEKSKLSKPGKSRSKLFMQ
ncbi:hypothetical protein EGR_01208 [Echinococcus granulosus]|uniref:G-protein coupled receptors family 1 profile domain-containing protein n=1 Tax=Echinococcus granulosus TaxID=6210 RepID=W6UQV1_ECHGR|nr:hypothetical protein EGR_01208 [Echinococcus granulosus]EUB64080.1 hypothetical protein EGR_01208 [Echinococcus granulosus]